MLAAFVVAATAIILHRGHGLTFFLDEWAFVLKRAGHSPDVLLHPHNEHPSLSPLLVDKALFKTVGLTHDGVYRSTRCGPA